MAELIKKSYTVQEDSFVHVVPPGEAATTCGLEPRILVDEGYAVPSCPECLKEMDAVDVYARYRIAVAQRDEYAAVLKGIRDDLNLAGFEHSGSPDLKYEGRRVKKLVETHTKHRKMVIKAVRDRNVATKALEDYKSENPPRNIQTIEVALPTVKPEPESSQAEIKNDLQSVMVEEKPIKQESPVTKIGQKFITPMGSVAREVIEVKQGAKEEWYVFDISTLANRPLPHAWRASVCKPISINSETE